MANRVYVSPVMLRWARERSGRSLSDLERRNLPVQAWETQQSEPTMRQLELFASATHTPIGFLFLTEPPNEVLPIPDFRTFGDLPVQKPSPDLLDTIYACEQRQAWYRDFVEANGGEPVIFVASMSLDTPSEEAATQLRALFGFELGRRSQFSSWSAALSGLSDQAEEVGVLVMISGIVGANTRRVLNPDEFRGFALADNLAPVVFINGADTKAAQIFSLGHELAHLALSSQPVSAWWDAPIICCAQGLTSSPVEQKPKARRAEPFHVMQVAAQCILVEEVYGRRPPYGCSCLQMACRSRCCLRPHWTSVCEAAAEMREFLLRDADPGLEWVGPKCRACGFRTMCWQ